MTFFANRTGFTLWQAPKSQASAADKTSELHARASRLVTVVNNLLQQRQESLLIEVQHASKGLMHDITSALLIHANSDASLKADARFANTCMNAQKKYQPILELEPEFFNKFSLYVKKLSEATSNVQDWVDTQKTPFKTNEASHGATMELSK